MKSPENVSFAAQISIRNSKLKHTSIAPYRLPPPGYPLADYVAICPHCGNGVLSVRTQVEVLIPPKTT